MKSSNQCVFVSKLFFQLLGTAIVVLMVGGLLHTRSATAASGNAYTGNYVIENSLGKTVIPIPDGVWHEVHEEVQHKDSGSGDFVSTYQFQIVYLVQLDDIRVSGVVRISTNKEFHSAGWWKPSNFCYREKWKYIKQESVLKKSAFCWGVRYVRFRTKPRQDTSWERAVKKIEKAGWFAPLGIRGTLAKYTRSDSDKMLNVSYSFFLIPRMSWLAARNWLYDLKPRIQAGFQGKFLTPPKGPATAKAPTKRLSVSMEEQRRLSRSEVRSLLLGHTEVGVLRRPSRPEVEGDAGQTYKAYYQDNNTVWYKLDDSDDIKRWDWKILETGVVCRGPDMGGQAWCRAIAPDGAGRYKAVGFRTGNLRYQFRVEKGLFGLPKHLLK